MAYLPFALSKVNKPNVVYLSAVSILSASTSYGAVWRNCPSSRRLSWLCGISFTDPYYQRDCWTRTAPDPSIGGQKVYYLPPGAARPVVADDQLKQPSGIIGTPDGRQLYVADIGAGKTYRYQVEADGRLSNRQLFVSQGSEGMTIDNTSDVSGLGKSFYST